VITALLGSIGGHGIVSDTVSIFVALLGFAVTVAILTKFIRIPYTIALVLAGLVVAILHAAPEEVRITEELVFVLLLPPLLFQAGSHMDLDVLQRKAIPVAIMAVPGVIVSMVAVGLAIQPFLPQGITGRFGVWLPALLLGALLAPTDPISVLATFKQTSAPEKLKTMVEGESLFNDGTGVVLFLILLEAIVGATGETTSIADGIIQFVRVTGLGIVIGLGLGLVTFWVLTRLDDHVLENAITVVLVWGSFITAEKLHASGVIAVVVSGLIMGNYGSRLAMSKRTRRTIHIFWESVDFIVNSIVFLLIGIELQVIEGGAVKLLDPKVLLAISTVYVVSLAARAVMVYPLALTYGRHWPRGWKHVVFWAGLKGSIPLALVLGLPLEPLRPIREFLVPVVFGVVLISLLLQGLTIPSLIGAVDVGESEPGSSETDE
jgi:CPA1 family monovalent cation:H+ antiporter